MRKEMRLRFAMVDIDDDGNETNDSHGPLLGCTRLPYEDPMCYVPALLPRLFKMMHGQIEAEYDLAPQVCDCGRDIILPERMTFNSPETKCHYCKPV